MNYWWVNQNQTHVQEISGGYMWSPKKKTDGSSNTFYDNMIKVRPGDIVFSFFDTKISFLGSIKSHGYSQAKPELGAAGEVWESDGWMVNVDYRKIRHEIRPVDHIDELRPLLPMRYSPLQSNGRGNQGVYLTQLSDTLAKKLINLIGEDAQPVIAESSEHEGEVKTDEEAEADRIEKLIKKNPAISETEKETLIKARKGQGRFREDVLKLHRKCPFTGITNTMFLRAGHLKPWSKCQNNQERLDPLNGISLTPVADQLVDQGLVTFDSAGRAVFSSLLEPSEAAALGIEVNKEYRIKILDQRQEQYLNHHRTKIFKNKA